MPAREYVQCRRLYPSRFAILQMSRRDLALAQSPITFRPHHFPCRHPSSRDSFRLRLVRRDCVPHQAVCSNCRLPQVAKSSSSFRSLARRWRASASLGAVLRVSAGPIPAPVSVRPNSVSKRAMASLAASHQRAAGSDADACGGWSEADGVMLLGPGGRQFDEAGDADPAGQTAVHDRGDDRGR